jgi:hypothetical protein
VAQDVERLGSSPLRQVVVSQNEVVGRRSYSRGELFGGLNHITGNLEPILAQGEQLQLDIRRIVLDEHYAQFGGDCARTPGAERRIASRRWLYSREDSFLSDLGSFNKQTPSRLWGEKAGDRITTCQSLIGCKSAKYAEA